MFCRVVHGLFAEGVWVAVGGAVCLVSVTLASALLTLAESKEIGCNLMLNVPLGEAVSMTAALLLVGKVRLPNSGMLYAHGKRCCAHCIHDCSLQVRL